MNGHQKVKTTINELQNELYNNGKSSKPSTSSSPNQQHHIQLKRLDHYTLITHNAKQTSTNHTNILNYKLDKIKPINSGTVSDGDIDMLNYIMKPPSNDGGSDNDNELVMVVTEGLNDDTVFRKYMKKFGEGIHHFAFEVDNIDSIFKHIKELNIQTTSDHVTTDMLSGLKQFFIQPCHAGFFIELIEMRRKVSTTSATTATNNDQNDDIHIDKDASLRCSFSNNNMAELAQSIRNLIVDDGDDDDDDDDEANENTTTEEEYPSLAVEDEVPGVQIDVGDIVGTEICVENVTASANFLTSMFNFRMISVSVSDTGQRIHLRLVSSITTSKNNGMNLFLVQAVSKTEERQATMIFNTVSSPNLTESVVQSLGGEEYDNNGMKGIVISLKKYFSYKVLLLTANPQFQVVRCDDDTNELNVDIQGDVKTVVDYLANPTNLKNWSGHRAIHYSKQRDSWVETRKGSNGGCVDYNLHINVEEDTNVTFHWPDRGVEVVFLCTVKTSDYTMVSITLPSSMSERRLARMKRIFKLQLDLLKGIIEGNVTDVIYDRHYQHIQAYHLSMYGEEVMNQLPDNVAHEFNFKGKVLQSGSIVDIMSTDFALTIKSNPLAVLQPTNLTDVAAAIHMANELDIPLAARGSQVSHSAGGQAQANNGLLIDMSCLSYVEFVGDTQVKLGPGTMWDQVMRETLAKGLMPPVINDYQYLSVGGTISMGGVGFMSHQYGLQASYVDEMEVVTGQGDIVTCSKDINQDLFDCCRGGLGQVGIIGSVTIPLVKAPKDICIFKLFYDDINAFVEDVQVYVANGNIDMIHAFLKPSSAVSKLVGGDKFSSSSSEFQSSIKACQPKGDLVVFLELGCYIWDAGADLGAPQTRCMSGQIFKEVQSFSQYITKDPPVVETNKAHGSVPHPSYATMIDEKHVVQLLKSHISSPKRGNDHVDEILIMPLKSNTNLSKGYRVPMCPLPDDSVLSFFLLFLGSVVPGETDVSPQMIMSDIREHHRSLYRLSNSLGGKRYSYDTITSEVVGSEWRAHFGEATWEKLRAAKRLYDPNHMLCPGLKIWE